jgi:tetratricopeptide (TPR) repeat protein
MGGGNQTRECLVFSQCATSGLARRYPIRLAFSWLVLVALQASGCVEVPKRPAAPDPPPPQAPQNAAPAATLDLSQKERDSQDQPRNTASPRQKFQVHIDFGRIFETQGNFDAAIMEYQDALTILKDKRRGVFQPADEALAHRRIGGALDRLGRFAQAEVHYKKALTLAQKDPRVWNDTGYSYYLQGRFAEAEIAFKTALRIAPDDERIKTNLGLALAAAGRSDEALSLLSRSTSDAIGHANLGYLLAATGQLDLARQQYETSLALRPDLELARRALVQLDRQQNGANSLATPPVQTAQSTSRVAPELDSDIKKTASPRAHSAAIPPPHPWLDSSAMTDPR